VLFRESWENSPVSDEDLKDNDLEGVKVVYNSAITRLIGEKDQLNQIEYTDSNSLEKTTIAAGSLVIASGRFPELVFMPAKPEVAESELPAESATDAVADISPGWQAIPPYKQPVLKGEVGLFAEGEALADYSAAIKAIGAGRRAAASIHLLMSGVDPALAEEVLTPQSTIQDVDHVEDVHPSQRQIMPICSGSELAVCGEIERGFSEDMARTEASRCLQCGLICYDRSVQIEESVESEAVTS
jgi:NADPH-dependent glutamate synthase beta subunit-like oxidoreductase